MNHRSNVVFATYFYIFMFCGTCLSQVRHDGMNGTDRFLLCAQKVFGKPVVYSPYPPLLDESVACPASPDVLVISLKSRGVSVFEGADFVYLIPSQRFVGGDVASRNTWQHAVIHFTVENMWGQRQRPESKPESMPLTTEERTSILKTVLANARSVPMDFPTRQNAENLTVNSDIALYLDAVQLKPNSQAVVGLLGGRDNGAKRLVYGEIQKGKYQMRWDSPLLETGSGPKLEYVDVDGDGVPEIVLRWFGGNYPTAALVIFDTSGNELTRLESCDEITPGMHRIGGTACPLYGATLDEPKNGKRDILVWESNDLKKPVRYALIDGRYVSETATGPKEPQTPSSGFAKPQTVPNDVALNAQGLELMKQRKYDEAAARFAAAAEIDDENPQYANNAGYAQYRQGNFEIAVLWLNDTIRLDRKRAVAYLNLGDAYAKLNRSGEARQAYTKYLELAPDSKEAPDVKKKLAALPPSP